MASAEQLLVVLCRLRRFYFPSPLKKSPSLFSPFANRWMLRHIVRTDCVHWRAPGRVRRKRVLFEESKGRHLWDFQTPRKKATVVLLPRPLPLSNRICCLLNFLVCQNQACFGVAWKVPASPMRQLDLLSGELHLEISFKIGIITNVHQSSTTVGILHVPCNDESCIKFLIWKKQIFVGYNKSENRSWMIENLEDVF